MTLVEIIEKARRAQQDHEQRHDVQLEIPSGLMFDTPDDREEYDANAGH
jgi:hypothetical protein